MPNQDQYYKLVTLLLPEGVLDYFKIADIVIEEKKVHVHLEELDIQPAEYQDEKLISKGFRDSVTIQDFPLRNKAVYLHIRRRRWKVESSGDTVSRDWNLVASGTRLTSEFASFLKGILGYTPGKL